MAVIHEAYVAGVSTRKVDQVVETLGLRVSKSEVSRICQALDEQVEAFHSRPLEGRDRAERTLRSQSPMRAAEQRQQLISFLERIPEPALNGPRADAQVVVLPSRDLPTYEGTRRCRKRSAICIARSSGLRCLSRSSSATG